MYLKNDLQRVLPINVHPGTMEYAKIAGKEDGMLYERTACQKIGEPCQIMNKMVRELYSWDN